MNDLEFVQEDFKEKVGSFILAVQTMKIVDYKVAQDVVCQSKLLARLLKDKELVSKSILNELYTAARMLRTEAPFIKGHSDALVEMAEQLELTFYLILRGECHDDRVSGVPRVI
ncbi:hypothetical protein [Rugamonas rubra]|uniref:hypothetical protein n=1 Tax=Rugamonas rubra TaxID=758825 RepID=UPI001113921D|nr:hypothetical protein [Rugamonas rubra]